MAPTAKRALVSAGRFIRRFRTQAETTMAQTRCKRRVKGLMLDVIARLKNIPKAVMIRAVDDVTRVRLSHLGVVSRKFCFGSCMS